MDEERKKTIFCTSCGAEFDESLPYCPYCQTMNYIGAEAEYLRKLEDVREDLDDLQDIPMNEVKHEVRGQLSFIKKIMIVVGCIVAVIILGMKGCDKYYSYEEKKNMQITKEWITQLGSQFDELYEQQKFGEMVALYNENVTDDFYPSYQWKYAEFMHYCTNVDICKEYIERANTGEELSEGLYCNMLFYEWRFIGKGETEYMAENLKPAELAYIQEIAQPLYEDFDTRWGLTEAQIEEFQRLSRENYNILDYDVIKEFVQEWYAKERK